MKIQVRKNAFETNSSSMHSIVLCNTTDIVTDDELLKFLKSRHKAISQIYEDLTVVKTKEGNRYIYVSGKSFGTEFGFYEDWKDKLLYLIADANSTQDIALISKVVVNRIHEINDPVAQSVKGLVFAYINPNYQDNVISSDYFGGYDSAVDTGNTDHQSSGLAHNAVRIINENNYKSIKDLIFSKRFVIFTDSDGGCYLHEHIQDGTLSTEKFIAEVYETYIRRKIPGKKTYETDYDHPLAYWKPLKDYLRGDD